MGGLQGEGGEKQSLTKIPFVFIFFVLFFLSFMELDLYSKGKNCSNFVENNSLICIHAKKGKDFVLCFPQNFAKSFAASYFVLY